MSQEMTSQKMKRTCEGCGIIKEWELVGMQVSTIQEMQEWYTVIREVFVDGQFMKIMVQACSLACVPPAAIKLALPQIAEEPPDDIDLTALREASDIN